MPLLVEKVRQDVYEEMCTKCEREHYCHNACENCEEYEDRVEEIMSSIS